MCPTSRPQMNYSQVHCPPSQATMVRHPSREQLIDYLMLKVSHQPQGPTRQPHEVVQQECLLQVGIPVRCHQWLWQSHQTDPVLQSLTRTYAEQKPPNWYRTGLVPNRFQTSTAPVLNQYRPGVKYTKQVPNRPGTDTVPDLYRLVLRSLVWYQTVHCTACSLHHARVLSL
ncbi:UNVERIFIED_CONTAM: hypothetical protein FKN15_047678 [Acipenser sinensis]